MVDSAELLLAGDSLVVIGSIENGDAVGDTRLLTYDISDPSAPALVDDRAFDATLVSAVQHDDDVRLVLNGGLPDLDFVQPRFFWRDGEEAVERNREVVRDSAIEDWLPTVTTYDADGEESDTAPLLDCATVTVPDSDDAALGTMAAPASTSTTRPTPTGSGSPPTPGSPTSPPPGCTSRPAPGRRGAAAGTGCRWAAPPTTVGAGSTGSSSTAPTRRTSPRAWSTA